MTDRYELVLKISQIHFPKCRNFNHWHINDYYEDTVEDFTKRQATLNYNFHSFIHQYPLVPEFRVTGVSRSLTELSMVKGRVRNVHTTLFKCWGRGKKDSRLGGKEKKQRGNLWRVVYRKPAKGHIIKISKGCCDWEQPASGHPLIDCVPPCDETLKTLCTGSG